MIFVPEAWRIYTDELHRQFRKFFATWAPAEQVAIGDLGFLDHARFVKVGTLEHFGLARLKGKAAGTDPRMNFQSQHGLEVSLVAEGAGAKTAHVSITFNNKSAVLFNALNCTHTAHRRTPCCAR